VSIILLRTFRPFSRSKKTTVTDKTAKAPKVWIEVEVMKKGKVVLFQKEIKRLTEKVQRVQTKTIGHKALKKKHRKVHMIKVPG
jgi:hypothetical protein